MVRNDCKNTFLSKKEGGGGDYLFTGRAAWGPSMKPSARLISHITGSPRRLEAEVGPASGPHLEDCVGERMYK